MKSFLRYTLLYVLAAAASATYFELDSSPTCGDDGLTFDIELTCSSSETSECISGDVATVTGTMVIPEGGMSDTVKMTNRACLMGIQSSMTCDSYDFETSLCSLFDLEQYGCPAAGEYDLDGEFTLPENSNDVWWNTYVTIYTTIASADDSEEMTSMSCMTQVNLYKGTAGNATSSSSFMIGFSAVMLAGLGAFVYKRRRTAKIDLTKEEAMLGNFEMMNDSVRV